MFSSPLLLGAVAVEGYVVLAVELLAIRQLTPYVGNATDTVAIVIAAVLLPLAFGYEAGGRVRVTSDRAPGDAAAAASGAEPPEIARAGRGLGGSPDRGPSPGAGPEAGVRRRLTRNLLLAALILSFGLSHPYLVAFFGALDDVGITHRLVQTALHACLFLVYPVYLLGQTVPLVAHCSTGASLPRSTGLMLFFSTFGSFLGSVVSTLVLMTFWGVHATVAFTLGLLVLLAGLIGRGTRARAKQVSPEEARRPDTLLVAVGALGLYIFAVNAPSVMRAYGIVGDSLHSQIRVLADPAENSRLLVINNSPSSKWAADPGRRFAYVEFIEREVLGALDPARPRRVLVIGAGGFTIGLEDEVNAYTYVDIDPALRGVSEEHFLGRPLGANKLFVAESARAFLRRAGEPYDAVVLDAFTNRLNMPPDLITREAFAAVRRAVAPGGRVVVNVIASPDFADRFSRSMDATIRAVFPFATRHVLNRTRADGVANVLYVAVERGDEAHDVYTDDRNRSFLDR